MNYTCTLYIHTWSLEGCALGGVLLLFRTLPNNAQLLTLAISIRRSGGA